MNLAIVMECRTAMDTYSEGMLQWQRVLELILPRVEGLFVENEVDRPKLRVPRAHPAHELGPCQLPI